MNQVQEPKYVGCLRMLARLFGMCALAIAALSLFELATVIISDFHKSGFSLGSFFSWFSTLLLILVIAWGGAYFWKMGNHSRNEP